MYCLLSDTETARSIFCESEAAIRNIDGSESGGGKRRIKSDGK